LIAARKNKSELPPVAYKLSDMAADGMGLLSALGIVTAHILGCSMGGMIVQTMAIEHPQRVLSLTSVMSTTGESDIGQSTKEANTALLAAPASNRQDYIDQGVATRKIWSSKRHFDGAWEATRLGADWDRGIDPSGHARQFAAIIASGHRADALRTLTAPTLVIHGRDDTLIDPTGGLRTAELVPGSVLAYLSDMGHDLPRPQWPLLVDLVIGHQNRATD
jgi:pimeloyl-ACP methyl ester carboxylesterase